MSDYLKFHNTLNLSLTYVLYLLQKPGLKAVAIYLKFSLSYKHYLLDHIVVAWKKTVER